MSRMIALAAATLLSLTAAMSAMAGKYYRWVDENGVTHYTATPPENRPSESIKLKSPPPDSATGKPGTTPTPVPGAGAAAGPGTLIPTVQTPPVSPGGKSEADAKNCAIARRNLETLNTRTQVRLRDPATGQYRMSSGEEQAQARADAEAKIQQYCR